MSTNTSTSISFVCCASDLAVLQKCLLASPCLQENGWPLAVYFNTGSAAAGFNAAMMARRANPTLQGVDWLIWVHQDVLLPGGWDTIFLNAIADANHKFDRLAVVGVYGIAGREESAQRVGHVLDRGVELNEPSDLPCLVDSLDELLFAVRVDSGLLLDPDLGFDFYGTDVVLEARAKGWQSAVVDAYCEHWSGTPSGSLVARNVVDRIVRNAETFENKWILELPITTPCSHIAKRGDVAAFIKTFLDPTE
jgi:hypothetical protein